MSIVFECGFMSDGTALQGDSAMKSSGPCVVITCGAYASCCFALVVGSLAGWWTAP